MVHPGKRGKASVLRVRHTGLVYLAVFLSFLPLAQAQLMNFSRLHAFSKGNLMGQNPQAGLREGSDGLLYGTASQGGQANGGIVFRVSKDGSGFAVLHDFGRTPGDGRAPSGPVTEASDGLLYGTSSGGGSSNRGTVFQL